MPATDRLFRRLHGDTPAFALVHDVPQVLKRPGETINPSDDECVAGAQKVEQYLFSVRPSRRVPLAFSARIAAQPAAASAECWIDRS